MSDDEYEDIPPAVIEGHSKKLVKQKLMEVAMEKYRLSYVIQGFSGNARWDLMTYTLHREGNIVIIKDDDTDMTVMSYENPGKWWFEYKAFGQWEKFIPEEVYGEWKIGTSAKWKDVAGGGWYGS